MVSDDIVFSKQLFNTDVLSQYPGGGATFFLAGVDHGTYETERLTRRYPPICRPSDRTSIVAKTKRNGGSIKATASQARENLSVVRRLFSFAVMRQFAFQYEFWYSADVM